MSANSGYDASSIGILKGLDAVKLRPGMYVGDVTSVDATHHLLYEIFDNSVDEALAGHASKILVVLHADGSASVQDDGRGIPVDIHPEEGVSAAEVVLTTLHAGGKFDHDSYQFSGGLHGVGSACTNALSDWMDIAIKRDGALWKARFEAGITVESVARDRDLKRSEGTGTFIRFRPSSNYLRDTVFVFSTLARRFREVAYLNPGIVITFRDEREGAPIEEVYDFPGGVSDLVRDMIGDELTVSPIIPISGMHEGVVVDVAFAWRSGDHPEEVRAYANNIPQSDGGQHLTGFRATVARVLMAYAERNRLIKRSSQISAEDLREGIAGAVHVKIRNVAFSSQTKEKLISVEARTAVEAVVGSVFERWLDEHPEEARNIIGRAQAASEAREAAKRARELTRKKSAGGRVSVLSLPEKLADCSSRVPEERELFLVEGDSAGGSAKQGRDRERQAILPLRGKILNVERANAAKTLKNEEIAGIIQTLAAGYGPKMDLSALRYHKLVIMTDADVDGSHIATLILTLFFRHLRPMLEAGHVYIAVPPLYRIRRKGEEDLFVPGDSDLTRNFVERALTSGAVTINGEQAADGFLAAVEPIIIAEARFTDAVRAFGHPALAEAALSFPAPDGFIMVGKAASAALRKRMLAVLTEIDPEAEWSIVVETGENGLRIEAQRDEDGVEETYTIGPDALGGFGVRAVANAWAASSLGDAELAVGGTPAYGPIALIRALREAGGRNAAISRYKGLGEMNPEELWDTTMNPATRRLRRVTIEDAQGAEAVFSDLMGDNVTARRTLIDDMFVNTNGRG